jgi:hypothetical protein
VKTLEYRTVYDDAGNAREEVVGPLPATSGVRETFFAGYYDFEPGAFQLSAAWNLGVPRVRRERVGGDR